MLWLDLQAPFAACRPIVAGWYRPTAGFLTHSAVYGLVLNIAGIEFDSRLGEHEPGHDGKVPASLTRPGLPVFRLALGLPGTAREPMVQTLYQQLHTYPVGTDAGINPALAKGRKNHIVPTRREFLCDVHALAVVDADENFEIAVRRGLKGEADRYGLPFLGDNNFVLDSLELVEPQSARWYTLVGDRSGRPRPGATRLTTYTDRSSMAGTRSALFAPEVNSSIFPPETSRVPVGSRDLFDAWLGEQMARQ